MSMDGSKNKMVASMSTVLCQLGQDPSASYIDMNYNSKRTPSHPGSVSDDFTYLPMDYTPRSSRNPSRQSSQVIQLSPFSFFDHGYNFLFFFFGGI